jgi:hypothetical protein
MTPFVLVITSCLSTGGDCYQAPAFQDLREVECRSGAQPMLAKWQGEHPKRRVVRYACVAEERLKMFLNGGEA